MRPFFTVLVLVGLSAYPARAQRLFGHEWINYQQTYYKIPVAQPGLYRVTFSDLQQAGLPLANLDPKTLQLFHRGVEQAILVEGEADGKFDATDYIEFLGQGNDGTQDSALYRPASAQPHPYYSLYSDTTAYFLTARLDAQPGKRMARYTDLDAGTLAPQPYVWAEERRVFTDQYPAGNIYPMGAGYGNGAILTAYDVGEGWMGPSIKPQTRYEQSLTLTKAASTSLATPTLTVQYIGRTPTRHTVQAQVGPGSRPRSLDLVTSDNYDPYTLSVPLTAADVADGGRVVCSLSPQNENDEVSMAYLRVRYPQQPDLDGFTYRTFQTEPVAGGRALLRLTGMPPTGRVFDITTPGQTSVLSGTLVSGTWTSVVRQAGTSRQLLMASTPLPVVGGQRVLFRNINPAKANFLLVTHPALRVPTTASPDAIADYAAYRASKAGGGYDTLSMTVNQLFNQFSYGERNAVAIRRFVEYLSRNGSPKVLLLVGQSRDPQGVRKNPLASSLDMVPSAGWPGSDLALVTGLAGRPDYVPAVAVGRLNVTQPQQVLDYLNKVKEHEAAPPTAPWRKQMLHLSGGRSAYELSLFRSYIDEFTQSITRQYVSASVETVAKRTDDPVEAIPIADQVNRGLGFISMFGHSSLDVADIDIGYVSNDRLGYRNKGRYPLLLANGCASGNFYFGPKTFVSDWVLTPDRGAILALAHTYNGFAASLKTYTDNLYSVLTDSAWYARPFGDIQVETIRRYMLVNNSIYDKTNAEQITLQGDPAVRLFPFSRPDLAFSTGGVQVNTPPSASQPVAVTLSAVVLNLGRGISQRPEVRVRHYAANGQLLTEKRQTVNAATYSDTLRMTLPVTTLAGTFFEFYADADGRVEEERKDNNGLRVKSDGQLADLPFEVDNTPPVVEVAFDGRRLANNAFVAPQPTISVQVSDENERLVRTDPAGLDLYLQRPCAQQPCPFEQLAISATTAGWSHQGGTFRLTYRLAQPLPDGVYTLEVYGSDLSGNRAQPYAIRFVVNQQTAVQAITVAPNPFADQTTLRYVLTGSQPPQPATLRLFDLSGRGIRTLQLPTTLGTNEFVWDGTNDSGVPMAAGSYLYRLDLPGYDRFEGTSKKQLTGRIVLTR